MAEPPYNPGEEDADNFISDSENDEFSGWPWNFYGDWDDFVHYAADYDYDYDDDDDEEEEEEDISVVDSARVPLNIDLNSVPDSVEESGEEPMLIDDENYEWNRSVDGLFCPICMDAWSDAGDHHVSCLPCGHLYGLSCIRKWMKQKRSSGGKCPQCKMQFSLSDVRKLFAPRVVAIDDEAHKIIRSLEVKCARLEKKNAGLSRKERELKKNNAELQDMVRQLTEERHRMVVRVDQLHWHMNAMLEAHASTTQRMDRLLAYLRSNGVPC